MPRFCDYFRRMTLLCALSGVVLGGVLSSKATASGLLPARPLNSYATHDNYNPNDQRPRVATDEMGNWLSMWNVSEVTSQFDPQPDLAFSSSTTSGTTWGAPVIPGLLPGRNVISADLAYAGNGKWIAMWISEVDNDYSNRQAGFAISDDLGQTWSAPQAVPAQVAVDTRPWKSLQLASDNTGNLVAVWLQQGPGVGTYGILTTHSSDSGQTWAVPIELSGIDNNTTFDTQAQIAYAGAGQWVLVYTHKQTVSEIELTVHSVAKSNDFGANWVDIGPLFLRGSDTGDEPTFALEADNGKVVVAAISPAYPRPEDVFTDGVGIFVSDDSLTTFPTSLWVETAEINATGFVTAAADDSGNWLLAARAVNPGTMIPEYPAMNPVLFWRSTDPGTTWTATGGPASGGVNSYMQLAGAGAGDFVMIMEHFGPPETLADADVDIQAVTTGDHANTWSDVALVNSPDPADLGSVSDTRVDLEAGDGMIMACWLANVAYPPGQVNIPASRISPIMISRSLDDGRTWSPAMQLPDAYGDFASPCAMRFLGAGTWECTWDTGLFSQGFLSSQSTDGGLTWSVPVSAAAFPTRDNTVAVSPEGNAVRVSSQTVESSPTPDTYTLETYVETSTDNGSTWQPAQLLHSETYPAMNVSSVYTGEPAVAYVGSGRFALLIKNIYLGRDLPFDINHLQTMNVYLAESFNNGTTWSTPETVLQTNKTLSPYDTPMVASNRRIVIAWPEYARETTTGDDSDIFFRSKTFGATSAAKDWSLFQ